MAAGRPEPHGVTAAILFGVGASLGSQATALVAFISALGAMALVLALAGVGGAITPGRMLVSGIAVGYLLNATMSMLVRQPPHDSSGDVPPEGGGAVACASGRGLSDAAGRDRVLNRDR
jgi:hypothetical protein